MTICASRAGSVRSPTLGFRLNRAGPAAPGLITSVRADLFDERAVRMAVDDHIGLVARRQRRRRRRAELVAVTQVNAHAVELKGEGVTELGACHVDVAADRVYRRDGPQRVEHGGTADVAGVQDEVDAAQRLQRFRTHQAVSVAMSPINI